jgi:hypothetical protein
MEIKKTENMNVTLSNLATGSTYVHSYGKQVDFDFCDTGSDGVQHNVEIKIPLALARELAEELVNDIAAYDEKQAEQKREDEAEEAERVAEELGVEDVGA